MQAPPQTSSANASLPTTRSVNPARATSGTLSRFEIDPIAPQRGDTSQAVRLLLRTTVGMIEIDLYRRAAPATVENFLRYVDGGYWSGGIFHRTVTLDNQPDKEAKVKIEVIQGAVGDIYRQYALPPIELETTEQTGLKHLDGTLSMARDEPNSAQYEFFICLGAQPALDFGGKRNPDGQGFAAFGRVVKGMDVVKKIHRAKSAGQSLTPPILIMSLRRK
ncbi:MAG: peptidylprolyl isomerase [Candidatus Kapaibacterium sp.]|nr:MAG: peptidylprolyl isomerase [Candidatus Kapabacteria bacterium]